MRECPWCGRLNLNVYGYCQSCGRGFDGPEKPDAKAEKGPTRSLRFWPLRSSGGDR